ncbi:MAG: DUF2029 domain-containing protein [Deltaproteobacteria bacterium]|nr:MAG: DUF2029 domain-containing protein [Deltaproteobacteria bacterium]
MPAWVLCALVAIPVVVGLPWAEDTPWAGGIVLFAAGLPWLCLCLAWRRARLGGSLLPALAVCIAARLLLVAAPPGLSDDVYRYAWEGQVQQAAGAPAPFLRPPNDPTLAPLRRAWHARINHPDLSAIYFPAAQIFFRLFARGPRPVAAVRLALALTDVAALVLLTVWLRRRGDAWGALLYGACPLVLAEVAHGSHLDVLCVAALLAALFLWEGGRSSAAGAALAVGALVKPNFLVPATAVLEAVPRRRLFAALGGAAVMGAALFLPYAAAGRGLVASLFEYATRWRANDALYALVHALVAGLWPEETYLYVPALDLTLWPRPVARLVVLVLLGLFLLWLGAAARRAPERWPGPRRALYAATAMLLLAPAAHPWYWLWVAALVPLHFSWPLVVLLWTLPLHYLSQAWAAPWALRALVYLPALLTWLGLWVRRPRPWGEDRAAKVDLVC